MNNLSAAAAVGRAVSKSLRITGKGSIFTAVLVALNLSLDIIRRSKHKKFAIFSYSSNLLAIHNRHLETGYVLKFLTDYTHLSTPCPEKNGPPKHVKITLWIENDSQYFSSYHEKPSICKVYVKFHDN